MDCSLVASVHNSSRADRRKTKGERDGARLNGVNRGDDYADNPWDNGPKHGGGQRSKQEDGG
jgi:hypothetical protein